MLKFLYRRPYYCSTGVQCLKSASHTLWYNPGKKVCPECCQPLTAGKSSINHIILMPALFSLLFAVWLGYRMMLPPVIDKDLLNKADLMAASLSTLSADMANQVKSVIYIQNFFQNTTNPSEEIVDKYHQLQNNLVNAREKYLLLFRDAEMIDSAALNHAIENKIAALQRGGFDLQFLTTQKMHQQLKQYLKTRILESDRWLQELSELIRDKALDGPMTDEPAEKRESNIVL